jgi:hypothetical protein
MEALQETETVCTIGTSAKALGLPTTHTFVFLYILLGPLFPGWMGIGSAKPHIVLVLHLGILLSTRWCFCCLKDIVEDGID